MLRILLFILCFSFKVYASAIDVSSVATAGNGSAASPWTGWDTVISWVGEQEYRFPGGVYAYATSPRNAELEAVSPLVDMLIKSKTCTKTHIKLLQILTSKLRAKRQYGRTE